MFHLELGKGFTFVGRQQRISFDERHFRSPDGEAVAWAQDTRQDWSSDNPTRLAVSPKTCNF